MANRLRRRTSDQTVLGSNPAVAAALSPWTRLFTPIVPRRSLHISFYSLSGHPCKIYTGKKKKKMAKSTSLFHKGCVVKNWTTFEGVYFNNGMEQTKKKIDMYKQCCLEKKVSYLQESQNAIVSSMSDLRQEAPKCVS